jgi:regulator of protease activity HflC (stomatin/prohibitin superfamily)
MSGRLNDLFEFLRRAVLAPLRRLIYHVGTAAHSLMAGASRRRRGLLFVGVLLLAAYSLYAHPPFASVHQSEVVVRTNVLDGSARAFDRGTVLVLPGVHQLRRYSTRDQVFRPADSENATGKAPFQSNEGLSIGVDLTIRWTVDRARLAQSSRDFPDDLNADLVRPAVQGVAYPLFARHTVREIFSSQRAAIQQELMVELGPKLAALGLRLRGVDMGKVDLPPDYRRGMEKLLGEELETEKIRYNLQLKQAQVKENELEGEADKVRRQKEAEAAGEQQVIAAKAQEETMKHILPFKQKQIQQRQLEAEADKVARIRTAEGTAEARRIEASGEADSRQKLADAEAYRLEMVGKASANQMQREGVLLAHYPLLIQKTLADKLSDKVQVIIAPTPAAAQFIGSNLLGTPSTEPARGGAAAEAATKEDAP